MESYLPLKPALHPKLTFIPYTAQDIMLVVSIENRLPEETSIYIEQLSLAIPNTPVQPYKMHGYQVKNVNLFKLNVRNCQNCYILEK
jgi:hypothetical protein